jgi:hypothetical protein
MYKLWIEKVRTAEGNIIRSVMNMVNMKNRDCVKIAGSYSFSDGTKNIFAHYNEKGFLTCIDTEKGSYIIGETLDTATDFYLPSIVKFEPK